MMMKINRDKIFLTIMMIFVIIFSLYIFVGDHVKNQDVVFKKHALKNELVKVERFAQCSNHSNRNTIGWSFITTQKTPRYNCSHFMTLGRRYGGRLGNKMFQVAALIGIADMHGYTPVLRSDHMLFRVFDMMDINKNNVNIANVQDIKETSACRYTKHFEYLSHSKNWSLVGLLQSWKYFTDTEDQVRYAFRFKKDVMEKVKHLVQSIKIEGALTIGIHVRRGDFIRLIGRGYTVATLSYFNASIEYFHQKYKHVQFIVTSDDINWCRLNLGNVTNIHFSNFKEPEMDMALLSSCDHVIMTSGSFGWWAAWLSGGTVIYYKDFPKPGSRLAKVFNSTDYYPDGWIGMN